ncbi:MAG: lipid II:glycine glycyltransferase FemX [Aliihoeflea sp.]
MTDIAPRAAAFAPADIRALTVAPIDTPSEWNSLLTSVPFPHVTQAYAYGAGKAAAGWHVRRVAFKDGNRTVAICQLLEKRLAGLRVATRVNRGPLFLQEHPGDADMASTFHALRRGWGRLGRGVLLIAPALPARSESEAILRKSGFRLRNSVTWTSARVDLTRDEDAIIASFNPNFRNKIRKGERAGIDVEISTSIDAVEWLMDQHRSHMRELGLDYAGDAFYRGLANDSERGLTVLRIMQQGQPVAGIALVRAGKMTEYNVGWYGADARRLNAGNVLLWAAIREAKRHGCTTLDVGGLSASDGGFSQFKRGMNGPEYTLAGEWLSFL